MRGYVVAVRPCTATGSRRKNTSLLDMGKILFAISPNPGCKTAPIYASHPFLHLSRLHATVGRQPSQSGALIHSIDVWSRVTV